MKLLLSIITSLCLFAGIAEAQSNTAPTIKGTIGINYASRGAPGQKGIKDTYNLNLAIANSSIFRGTITDQPQIIEGYISKSVVQPRQLYYDLNCDVINPKNQSQTKNVGRLYGSVPIASDGTYDYDKGNLVVDILPIGNSGGFSSKFSGVALGKPLVRPANWLDTLQRQTVSITRSVNGKTTTVQLKKYDKMSFRNHAIGAGPTASYQSVTVNGEMLYDYDKSCWFFNGVTIQYAENNTIKIDRANGTIRWVESPQRKQNGEGEYQFDVRINEPPPSATAAFETNQSDESSFFEVDKTAQALVGTMKYKDSLKGDTTLSSQVTVDLVGNNLSKQQTMALFKAIILSSVVPMNAD